MKILFSGFRDKRHSSAGGYDQIVHFPNSNYISDQNVPFGRIRVGQRGKSINVFFLDLATRFLRYKYDVTHIFYGDTIIFPYLRNRKHKVVATVHLDVEQRTRLPKMFLKALKRLDGVIVLSTQQEKTMKEKYGINAHFIPHGFNKPTFSFKLPQEADINHYHSDMIHVFYSGTNYRDVNLLIKTLHFCMQRELKIVFHLVGQSHEIEKYIDSCSNYILYGRLSDDEYFSLLSSCDYNFLPLTFATANNALLEAQFLGIKSILPDIPGIRDYAAPSPMNMFYHFSQDLCSYWEHLQKQKKNEDLVIYSERFLWKNIYHELDDFYRHL